MKWILCDKDNETIAEFEDSYELEHYCARNNIIDYNTYKYHTCYGCDSLNVCQRSDYYGIFTGHYCEECYNNNYPHKKDRYPTIEHDGYGERLEDDY